MPDQSRISRSKLAGTILLLVVYLTLNFPFHYEEVFRSQSDQLGINFWPTVGKPDYIAAGFPFTFYLKVGSAEPYMVVFHTLNLILDLMIGLGSAGLMVGYLWYLARRTPSSAPHKIRRFSLADTLLLVGIVAAVLGAIRLISGRVERDQQLAQLIQQSGGRTTQSTMFPSLFKSFVPKPYFAKLARLTEVAMESPSQEIVSKVLERSQLRGLGLGGNSYDMRLLDKLSDYPLLAELRISGREFDQAALGAIAKAKQVESLTLAHTNITASALRALGDMPRLRYLDIEHTDVVLSQFEPPAFYRQIEVLHLPRPEVGRDDSLTLEGWDRLRVLRCDDRVGHRNRSVVRLELRQLPQLEKVELDSLQRYDLVCLQLPKLKTISAYCENEKLRVPGRYVVYHFPWARNVKLDGTPELSSLMLQVNGFEAIDIQDATNLELQVGSGSEIDHSRHPEMIQKPDIGLRQAWINSLQNAKGPKSFALIGVSLEGVDLSPLAEQPYLKKIQLHHNFLKDAQLAKVRDLPNLESIDLFGNGVSGASIERVAKHCPNLRFVQAHPEAIQRLRLENHANIEKLFLNGSPILPVDGLRLIEVPKLAERFDLPPMMRHLHVDQAPRLVGLSTREPWLEKAVLRGVKELKYFAGGGPFLTDSVAESLLECKELQKLTLAYSKVSAATLSKLGSLHELEYLMLPSAPVDDAVIQQWTGLTKMRTLHLDDALITNASLEVIGSMTQLENLSLTNTKVTSAGLAKLSALSQLNRIRLAGIELRGKDLAIFGAWKQLVEIDLSDTSMEPDDWRAFVSACPPYVAKLTLKRAKVDSQSLTTLANRFVGLKFDLEDADVETALELKLLEKKRLLIPEEDAMFRFSNFGFMQEEQEGAFKRGVGEVDVRFYRPLPRE